MVLMGLFLFSLNGSSPEELKVGKIYHGFKLVKEKEVKEYNVNTKLFLHQKSGARLLKVETSDDNKTFVISFKTPPATDTGLPHILEHSVLNGSKNFPVKSPFDVLMKGSLRTFLNAMTGSDRTMYPVSSRNDKDYFNLMHVYLDAVFFPMFYEEPKIFRQEGWHYELEKEDGELIYNGVVYNEMKGSFSSPNRELDYVVNKNLFPDTCYGFSSGGYPSAIPTLTYEQFKAFHQRYYHPSNSYILLYGDYDVQEELKFINEKYLSKFDKLDVDSSIPIQKPFPRPAEVVADYPVGKRSSTENQTYLNLTMVTGLATDRNLVMGLDVLSDVLVNLPSAPVRRALQDAGIGRDVSCYVDDLKQLVFSITVTNANPGDRDKFREIVYNTLKKAAREGLDKRVVEGVINRMEFRLREGRGSFKGLMMGMQALAGWFFADDPYLSLEFEKPLAHLKSALTNRYLEGVIDKNLVQNPHALLTVLKPNTELMGENIARLKKELADHKASLSAEEKTRLVEETRILKQYQKTPDTEEALNTIPLLSLKDIDARTDYYAMNETTVEKVPMLSFGEFSNNIIYVNFLFDASVIPQDLIPYAALLENVLGELNTKNFTFGDLDTEINIQTGGINTDLRAYLKNLDPGKILPRFSIGGKVMSPKLESFVNLCGEIVKNTRFDDPKRLKEVLTKHQAKVESYMENRGINVAIMRLFSYVTPSGQFRERTNGHSYYRFLTDRVKTFDTTSGDTIAKLKKVAGLLFNRSNLVMSVAASEKDIDKFRKQSKIFLKYMGNKTPKPQKYKFVFAQKNEGFTSASKVQYVLQGYNFKDLGYQYSGKMAVLNQILSREYLQKQIRVIGGAYGGFSSFDENGLVYFGSYRDPNLRKTLENYKNAVDYLKNFKANDRDMTRFIIGTLARYERPLTTEQKGRRALENYFSGQTAEDVLKERKDILGTTPEDIRNMTKMVSDILQKNVYCVYGNEKILTDDAGLFTGLIKVKE